MKKIILSVALAMSVSLGSDCTDHLTKFQKYSDLSENTNYNNQSNNYALKAGLYYQKFMICREVKGTLSENSVTKKLKYKADE